jgi:signal transduction histidine kinase
MANRLRQSLALRLALLTTLVFVLGASALFGVLYWELATALEARDRAAVERRAEDLAGAYLEGGVAGLRGRLGADASEEARSLFVRLLVPNGETAFANVPADWIDPQGTHVLVPDGWGGWNTREVHSVRVPRDAARDLAVSSRALGDGRLLQVARSTDSRAVLLAPLRRAFAETGGAALLVAMALGTALAWRATRPLRAVAATTRSILETGDLSARVPPPRGSGELAVLVRQLNTLLDKNSDHVRVLRETLDNLAHDLRTPLTRLRGTAELALVGGSDPAEGRAALADCIEQSDRVLHLLERLLDVSAAEGGALKLDRAPLDLRSLVEHAAALYREVAEEREIQVTLDQPEAAEVDADAVRLGQAVSNLLDNALKYTPPGGRVRVSTSVRPEEVLLAVSDTGPGVPPTERAAIWRRLYRGDASRSQRGLGLGLSLVRAIVEAHGGSVGVDAAPGGGACFTVRLPHLPAPG